jgi:hypothetical protein
VSIVSAFEKTSVGGNMRRDFTQRTIWLACLMLVFLTTFALGQGIVSGSLAGTVVDPQKAVVAGVTVVAKNAATGVEFKSITNDQGYFSIRSVPIGTYQVVVDAPNFKKLEVADIQVNTGVTTDMGSLTLSVGATAETVTVEAAAPLIETSNAQGSAIFSSAATATLPLNGGIDQLALLNPGVVSAGGSGFSNNNGAQFAANGQRGRSNNFQIDGQYNNDNSVAGPAIFVSNQDTLQEVQVVTNNFGAEYGRNSGTVVNYVTKSGTNSFHGSAYEYYTGNYADSLTQDEKSPLLGFCAPGQTSGCNPVVVPRDTENRWGGTIGGPIIPNKMFFFASYSQDTEKVSGQTFPSAPVTTPTPAGLATLASCYPVGSTGFRAVNLLQTIGPYAVKIGNPVPSNTSFVTLSDGTTSCPGVQIGNVTRGLPGLFNNYEVVARGDIALGPKDQFFARYLHQQQVFTGALNAGNIGGASTVAGGGLLDNPSGGQQIALDWTRSWTNHLVNQVRFSYERTGVFFEGGGGFPTCTTGSGGGSCPPTIAFSGSSSLAFGVGNNIPQARKVFNTQFQDNASWQHGRHVIKFGGEYVRQRSPGSFLPNFEGTYTFANLNAFLANTAKTLNLTAGTLNNNFKEQDAALYAADDWRFRDNLTLNLGVRWEYFQQAINLLASRTLAQQLGPNPFWSTSAPLFVTTVPFVPNVWHNFAPRVGFAWTPRGLPLLGENKTVIRGGFSMAYDPAFYNMFLNVATSAPVVNAASISPCSGCLAGSTAQSVQKLNLPLIPTGVNPGVRLQTRVTSNFHNPYAEEWTLGIQREITSKIAAEVRYVGTHTVGEFMTLNGNPSLTPLLNFVAANPTAPDPIPAGVTPCATPGAPGFASKRVDCNFTNLRVRGNNAYGHYNALQTQLKLMSWHGFTSLAAYTWSKNIDNNSEIFSKFAGNQAAPAAQNPFDTARAERGLSGLDYPHILTIAWQYELPWYKAETGALGHVLGGWALAGTYRYTSGQLWTPIEFPGDSSYCQNSFDSGFFSGIVSTCRMFFGNPAAAVDTVGLCTNAAAPNCGLVNYFTSTAFFQSQLGTAAGALFCITNPGTCSNTPIAQSAVHWIFNDANSANFFKTPFGNTPRNPFVRGDTVSTVNLNLIKNTRLTERVSMRLEANVVNVLNRGFYGTPDPYPADGNFAAGGSFGNTFFNTGGGGGPPFGGGSTRNSIGQGLAQRRIILGAHVSF